jgi:hypothetical protein
MMTNQFAARLWSSVQAWFKATLRILRRSTFAAASTWNGFGGEIQVVRYAGLAGFATPG